VANTKIVDTMNKCREPWTVNILAQKAGIACFKDEAFLVKTRRFIDREKKYLLSELNKIKKLKPYSSSANYILIRIVGSGLSSGKLYNKMAQRGILIRDCRSFKGLGDKFIRVAVKKRRENNLLIKNLKRALEK